MKCSFCGKEMPPTGGLLYVKRDAKVLRFCKAKCRRNMIELGRKARDIRWTEEGREALAQAAREREHR